MSPVGTCVTVTLYPVEAAARIDIPPRKRIATQAANATVADIFQVMAKTYPALASALRTSQRTSPQSSDNLADELVHLRRDGKQIDVGATIVEMDHLDFFLIPAVRRDTQAPASPGRGYDNFTGEHRIQAGNVYDARRFSVQCLDRPSQLMLDTWLTDEARAKLNAFVPPEDWPPPLPPTALLLTRDMSNTAVSGIVVESDPEDEALEHQKANRHRTAQSDVSGSVSGSVSGKSQGEDMGQAGVDGQGEEEATKDGRSRHTFRCFWVIPGKVLAGPVPSNQTAIKTVLKAGVRTFVDLRHSKEGHEYLPDAKEVIAEFFADGTFDAKEKKGCVDFFANAIPEDDGTDHEYFLRHLGQEWRDIGTTKPHELVELNHKPLAEHLRTHTKLSREDVRRFFPLGAMELRPEHVVPVGAKYLVPVAPRRPLNDHGMETKQNLSVLVHELNQRAAQAKKGEVIYIHCTSGHARTCTLCSALLGLAYHLSGPHAILLFQALHDIALPAFRLEREAIKAAGGAIDEDSGLYMPPGSEGCSILTVAQAQQVIELLALEDKFRLQMRLCEQEKWVNLKDEINGAQRLSVASAQKSRVPLGKRSTIKFNEGRVSSAHSIVADPSSGASAGGASTTSSNSRRSSYKAVKFAGVRSPSGRGARVSRDGSGADTTLPSILGDDLSVSNFSEGKRKCIVQ